MSVSDERCWSPRAEAGPTNGTLTLQERANGMFFTPVSVACDLLTSFLTDHHLSVRRVLDLAAGSGSLLVAAARTFASPLTLVGVEIDAMVAAQCRAQLQSEATPSDTIDVIHGDGLGPTLSAQLRSNYDGFDLVLGNPPFLSPRLRSQRFVGANSVDWTALRRQFPTLTRPTTDLSTYFVAQAFSHLRPGGVCGMIVPVSFLSSDGASRVRGLIDVEGEVLRVDHLPNDSFVASVNTVCVWIRRHTPRGALADHATSSWGSWVAESPALDLSPGPLVCDIARVTAGFRDEFYQLSRAVQEAQEIPAPDKVAPPGESWHRVLTVGHLGWGQPRWGVKTVKIGGRHFLRPVVAHGALQAMSASLRGMLVPKLVVAPQKKVVAPWIDSLGGTVPLTPVVSVLANDRHGLELSLLAAALGSPVASGFVEQRCAGTALSTSALKFSARDLGQVPLPRDRKAWTLAASVWPPVDYKDLSVYLDAIRAAYQIDATTWSTLLAWWLPRVGLTL